MTTFEVMETGEVIDQIQSKIFDLKQLCYRTQEN